MARHRPIHLPHLFLVLAVAVALGNVGVSQGGLSPDSVVASAPSAEPVVGLGQDTPRPIAQRASKEGTVYVGLDPAEAAVTVGDVFQVDVRVVAGDQPVDGAEVHVNFVPGFLQAVDALGNPVTQAEGGDTLSLTLINRVSNETGEIDYAAGTLSTPASGTFTLARVHFRALNSTEPAGTLLVFVTRDGNPTNVTYRGDSVLASANGGAVRISGAGALPAPIALTCGGTAADDTALHTAAVSDYGMCGSGFVAPEVAYALAIDEVSDITVTLTSDAALALFALSSLEPSACQAMGGVIELPSSPPGTYYFVVDGLEAGSYVLSASCVSKAATATASPTATPTASPTTTPTGSATATPFSTPTPSVSPSPTASPTWTLPATTSPTATGSRTPTSTPSSTTPAAAHAVFLPAVLRGMSAQATPTSSGTASSPTATGTASSTATEISTPTGTLPPSPTPTATATQTGGSSGTLDHPFPAECEGRYESTTAGLGASFDSYGPCGSGMYGPEAFYELRVEQTLDKLMVGFGGEPYVRLFLLSGPSPESCLGTAAPRSYLVLGHLAPGSYFLAVDGTREASYALTVRCFPMAPASSGHEFSAPPSLTRQALVEHQHLPIHP